MTEAPHPPERLHGRRRGRKLRPGQQRLIETALPRLSLDLETLARIGPSGVFARPPEAVWLEIGFGAGEHLAWQARHHPAIGLLGCEVYESGIAALLARLERDGIEAVRLLVEDARRVLDVLPDASIDRLFILFPDPWPKTRHHKRRLISRPTLDKVARVLADGAELRLATDDMPYLRVMLALACDHPDLEWLARHPADWRLRPADWPATRYEAKAVAEGRKPAFLRFRRRARA